DRLLDPLLHFVRVDLGRPFVKRPEVRVDAGVGDAWRGRLDRAHGRLKVIVHRTSGRHGGEPHACFRRRRRNRVGRDRFGGGRLGGGTAGGRENGLGRARAARRGHSDGGGSGRAGRRGRHRLGLRNRVGRDRFDGGHRGGGNARG